MELIIYGMFAGGVFLLAIGLFGTEYFIKTKKKKIVIKVEDDK